MNIPGNRPDFEKHDDEKTDDRGCKWNTIRFAISSWSTTMRLLIVLLVLLSPAYLTYLIIWVSHR